MMMRTIIMAHRSRTRAAGERKTEEVRFTPPAAPDELCSITLQPIADGAPPFADARALTCAELVACGHRFAALPLMTHMALNDTRCPVCRTGDANARLDAGRTFPDEAWAAALAARAAAAAEEEGGDDDESSSDDDDEQLLLYRTLQALQEAAETAPLVATFQLFLRATDAGPVVMHRVPLHFAPRQPLRTLLLLDGPHYHIASAAARGVRDAIAELRVRAIRVEVALAHHRRRPLMLQSSDVILLPTRERGPATHALTLRGGGLEAVLAREPQFVYVPHRSVAERYLLLGHHR